MSGKKSGKSKVHISKGERSNVSKYIRKVNRKEYLTSGLRVINQLKAFSKGKRVMVTIPNPNAKSETNKPFIRVTAQEAGWKKSEPYKMKQEGESYK